jgi:hypothetical protein
MSSRPKLTPLSALMPRKGSAARPEQFIERTREQARELSSEHATNEAQAVAVANEVLAETVRLINSPFASEPAREAVSGSAKELSRERSDERVNNPALLSTSQTSDPDDPAEYMDGPRSSVSFRMTERLKDRLRDYAHFSRRQKQDIMDQAVHEFLRREGY